MEEAQLEGEELRKKFIDQDAWVGRFVSYMPTFYELDNFSPLKESLYDIDFEKLKITITPGQMKLISHQYNFSSKEDKNDDQLERAREMIGPYIHQYGFYLEMIKILNILKQLEKG